VRSRSSRRVHVIVIAIVIATGTLAGEDVLAATLTVPTDFLTIQAAVDAANPLDEILVEPGTYSENLVLRSEISVRGREAARTWLAPADSQLPVVRIIAASDLRFSNFTLIDGPSGINVAASTGVQIANVVFDSLAGIAVDVDINSIVDVTNNVFAANVVAARRGTVDVNITNNAFLGNDVTITSPLGLINNNVNVESNCWSDNLDLLVGGVDTAYGSNSVVGDPLFVDTGNRDFHLEQNSPCIDIGIGDDIIDSTVADAGAYGGQYADASPFPVGAPVLTDMSTGVPQAVNIAVDWLPNLSYLVSSSAFPGGYRVHYKHNASGPPYDGSDAGNGTIPSPIDAGDVTTFTLSDLVPNAPSAVAPRLTGVEGRNESALLMWESVLGVDDYRVHYGVDSTDEHQVDTGDVTEFVVTGLVNGTTYRFAVSSLTQAKYYVAITAVDNTPVGHESDFSPEQSLAVGSVVQSSRSNELAALPEFVQAFPPLPDDGGCFIATAAYGADWKAEVRILREFRDRYLLTHAPGRWFTAGYYRLSPPLANYLRDRDYLRRGVRWLLTPLVLLASFLLSGTPLLKAVVAATVLCLGFTILHRRRSSRTAGPSVPRP